MIENIGRDISRRATRRSRRRQDLKGLVASGILIALSGCFGIKEDISDPIGPTEPVDHELRIVARNAGDGAGWVDVRVQAGTVTNSCPARLGPGQTCGVEVKHTSTIPAATIIVEPDDSSIFAEFRGDCVSTMPECTVNVLETTVTIQVDVVFNLGVARIDFEPDPLTVATGTEASLAASAFADAGGDTPVPGATFTWETSDAGIATVQAGTGGSATVSGVAAGEAWIRATARNGMDSVKVVVTG